jgi:hypothetical protein
VHLLFLISGFD